MAECRSYVAMVVLWVSMVTIHTTYADLHISQSTNHIDALQQSTVREIPKWTVFNHGEGGFPCIRIPAITRCGSPSMLHAFAECRPWIGDGCKPHKLPKTNFVASICHKNSTDDGVTWSPLRIIQPLGIDPTILCLNDSKTLLLQYNVEASRRLTLAANWQMVSKDNGITWSSPQYIRLGNLGSFNVGPGRGLQLSNRTSTPGRILFIGYSLPGQQALIWYSDDNGVTYNTSETILNNITESQLVETSSGYIMANMRNSNGVCKCRSTAMSYDGGKTFTKQVFDARLISPVCMGTTISTYNGSLIFANPANTTGRYDGLVRRSDDDGHTWMYSYPVTMGYYAYSCLTAVANQDEVGLLWETGSNGCTGESCSIAFSKIKVL